MEKIILREASKPGCVFWVCHEQYFHGSFPRCLNTLPSLQIKLVKSCFAYSVFMQHMSVMHISSFNLVMNIFMLDCENSWDAVQCLVFLK